MVGFVPCVDYGTALANTAPVTGGGVHCEIEAVAVSDNNCTGPVALGTGLTSAAAAQATVCQPLAIRFQTATGGGTVKVRYNDAYYVSDSKANLWIKWSDSQNGIAWPMYNGTNAKTTYIKYNNCTCTDAEYGWGLNGVCTAYKVYKYGDSDYGWVQVETPEQKLQRAKDRLLEIMQTRMSPLLVTSRRPLLKPEDVREIRARETLRGLVGELQYRRFLQKGFITARGSSGRVYQIFPGHGITSVYDSGNLVERLCVVLKGDFPPTDSLITRYLVIQNNEELFRSLAVKHSTEVARPLPTQPDLRPLPEIYAALTEGLRVA